MTSTKKNKEIAVTVIGAGLAGTEAVYQLIRRQIPVRLIEMRPKVTTGAHTSDQFAELVCSNSVGSNLPDRASGLLKEEMRLLGSYFMEVAYKYRVPAGNALAVDRGAFAREITRYLRTHKYCCSTALTTAVFTTPSTIFHTSSNWRGRPCRSYLLAGRR